MNTKNYTNYRVYWIFFLLDIKKAPAVKKPRKVNRCYDCYHAVSDGRDIGNKACGDVFNNNEQTVQTVNCTGHCMVSIQSIFLSYKKNSFLFRS